MKLVLARCLNAELVCIPCHNFTYSIRLLPCLTMMCIYIPLADEAMNFLVLKILELSNKEVDTPSDVVDLGQGSAEHKVPKHETSEFVTVATGNNYTKTAKLNGLPGHIPESSKSGQSSCCL